MNSCRECAEPAEWAGGTYCSQKCKERFAWRKRKAKMASDAAYREQQNAADTARRRAAGIKPADWRTTCEVDGCDELLGRGTAGLCVKHRRKKRRAEGLERSRGRGAPVVILSAIASRPGYPTKEKKIVCAVPFGILPKCPVCSRLMTHIEGGHIFGCQPCEVRAVFNQEEVAWLVTSEARSTLRSKRTSSSSAA